MVNNPGNLQQLFKIQEDQSLKMEKMTMTSFKDQLKTIAKAQHLPVAPQHPSCREFWPGQDVRLDCTGILLAQNVKGCLIVYEVMLLVRKK